MLVSQLKVVCCVTTITTSLYLLLYLTLPQDTCRSSPRPGDRTLHNFNEISVKEESQSSTTRNLSVLVRPERRTVVVEPRSDYCQENITTTLLIAVFSAPGNSLARATVRKTWAVQMRQYPGVKVVFFLGRDQEQDIQEKVMSEAEEHNDLVVEDFQESYLNLTVKTTYLLKWLDSSDCSRARFIFKVDDDVYVNPANLWATLQRASRQLRSANINQTNIQYALIGHVWYAAKANRNPASRYYLSPQLYPHKKLPTFLSGTAYIFTGSLLSPLYSCALRTPLINLEDVFLTGLCARKQLGLRLSNNKKFIARGPSSVNAKNICVFKKAVVVHNKYKPMILDKLWWLTTQKKSSCHK